MGSFHRTPAAVGIRGLLVAWIAAAILVLASVAPTLAAAPSPIKLSQPGVSDRDSALGDALIFRVEYRHRGGLAPASIVVRVGNASYPMRPVDAEPNLHRGAMFEAVGAPPAGKHSVVYEATDAEGAVSTINDGWITIIAPPAPPPPAPTGGSGASGSSGASSGSSGASTGSSGGSQPAPVPVDAAAPVVPIPSEPSVPSDRYGEIRDPGAPRDPTAPRPVIVVPSGAVPISAATLGDPRPAPSRLLPGHGDLVVIGAAPLAGLTGSVLAVDQIATMLVSALGGAAMLTAFLLFGRRRPDDDDPEAVAAAGISAANADGALASGGMVKPQPTPADPEMLMPRWRRPSLLEARKHDPARDPAPEPAPKLTFDAVAVPVADTLERRRIRYRVVRLLDGPDELIAAEIGLLDEGDEVALLERRGSYWLVLCPDGRRGWLHRMVLAAPAGEPEPPEMRTDEDLLEPGLAARLTALRASGIEEHGTWTNDPSTTGADAGLEHTNAIDQDVLAAYRAARARA